jgi:hypothetical protein
MKINFTRPIRNFKDFTEEEKGLLKLAFLLPTGVISLCFLLTPLFLYITD